MTVNKYFAEFKEPKEQNLTEDISIEMIQMAGTDVTYIERNMVSIDEILNENNRAIFEQGKVVEAYLNNADQYGGSGYFLEKFGTIVDRTMDFVISKKRFKEAIGLEFPKEGDLLYVPWNKALLQIDYVEHETNFYNLQKNYLFEIKCSLFTASYEEFQTDVTKVDDQLSEFSFNDEPYADNTEIAEEGDAILDFSEENPLGEI